MGGIGAFALGFQAKVLRSDIAVGLSGPDRVNDRIDALNIAVAYARRGVGAEVHVPSPKYQEYRDIWFDYRNATKDSVRIRNRIWGFCGEHTRRRAGASAHFTNSA